MGKSVKNKKPVSSAQLSAADFVHLHNHTHYSVLDGLQKIPEMLDRILQLGMKSVALTDHGTLSGAIEFYKAAKDRNLKPIIGMEAYVANRGHLDKDPQKDRSRFHLILLAMNNKGYENLMRLSSIANLDGYYFKPRIDHDLLEKYNEGLIVLSGCIGGEVGEYFRYGDDQKAEETARWYQKLFGDRYYFEIQDHFWDEQRAVNEKLIALAKKLGIEMVVTCDAHYCRHEDQEAHEILLCVQTGAFLTDENRFSLKDTNLFVTDPEEVIKRWGEIMPQAITNTAAIAERCNVELDLGKILIPKFPVPKGETEKSYLDTLVFRGLAFRYGNKTGEEAAEMGLAEAKKAIPKEILTRAEYELDVIDSMGFNGYFLIIWDFVKWGKDNGIVFGPGRGSAAGSIVSFALRITELDPLKYDLLFERFLNPDRISMPDIDIDIQHNRRDEVIAYVTEKYGSDRVANIVTFGKMFARNAVRDVARVLQVPYADADRLAKMIPPPVQGRHIPLKVSLEENAEIKAEYERDATAREVFDLAVRLEGTIRSHGVHAAGVVIAPEELVKYSPLEMAQKGVVATQYAMGPIEDIGILKMDFLGLSNLTIIKNALRIIRKVYKKDIDIATLPLDDKKTFELFRRGETTGVFQLESSGMKRYLRDLKPTEFDDIIAMGALYRPGPLSAGLTDRFIARKNGREEVSFDHPTMEPALKNTFGVMVYQEQFMRIVRDMCGFTGGESDTLRKAVGKKKRDLMAQMKDMVIEGAKKNNVPVSVAEKFWKDLEGFADYAFNKSHAACYGMISYQTAYLKAHYPAAFMAALMTDDYDNTDRLTIDITECRHLGIEVLPPDVNESFHEFAVVINDDKKPRIRFGLDAIKNVGHGAVEEILQARQNGGQFKTLADFAERVNVRTVNRKTWEALIRAGAMDAFGTRSSLLNSLDAILLLASKRQKDIASSQADLFGEAMKSVMPDFKLTEPATPIPKHELLQWERELLGLYLSDHPLKDYETILSEKSVPLASIKPEDDGKRAMVGGTITTIRQIVTKNGQNMAFVSVEDVSGEAELIVFPSVLKDNQDAWVRDNIILASGRVSGVDRNGAQLSEPKILVDSVQVLTPEEAEVYQTTGAKAELQNPAKRGGRRKAEAEAVPPEPISEKRPVLYVRINDTGEADKLIALKNMLENKGGSTEVVLVLGSDGEKQAVRLPHKVTIDEETVRDIAGLVGAGNVIAQ